jgi:hypothetical protein
MDDVMDHFKMKRSRRFLILELAASGKTQGNGGHRPGAEPASLVGDIAHFDQGLISPPQEQTVLLLGVVADEFGGEGCKSADHYEQEENFFHLISSGSMTVNSGKTTQKIF